MQAAAYILKVNKDRRRVLLEALSDEEYMIYGSGKAAEPVLTFEHKRKVPLIVLACFEDDRITHIADGRKGANAGTGLVRLNMEAIEKLKKPIKLSQLVDAATARTRPHLKRMVVTGGKLPPKSLGSVIDTILKLDPSLAQRLDRFSEKRRKRIDSLSRKEKDNLAFQKESLGVALEISGIGTEDLLTWKPGKKNDLFLDGIQSVHVREDAMLISDLSKLPGFKTLKETTHFAAKTFENMNDPSNRLTVIMANRVALEKQTGSDLIYFNEKYRSFIFVQYKAMEKGNNGAEFRWTNKSDFVDEIGRMDKLWEELVKIPGDREPHGFRLNHNPFFLKFCPRVVFNPDDKGLFKGFYLPLEYWRHLDDAGSLKGAKGGNLITFENVHRKFKNDEFIMVVANSWVGTTPNQSTALEKVIKAVLAENRTVTFAVKSNVVSAGKEEDDEDEVRLSDLF